MVVLTEVEMVVVDSSCGCSRGDSGCSTEWLYRCDRTHTDIQTQTYTHIHTQPYTQRHTHTHTHAHTDTHTHTHRLTAVRTTSWPPPHPDHLRPTPPVHWLPTVKHPTCKAQHSRTYQYVIQKGDLRTGAVCCQNVKLCSLLQGTQCFEHSPSDDA